MKKLIPLLAGLFAGIIPAFAQMLPDSTVQVVAYWSLGDKQKYQLESTKYKVAQGDTTVAEKSAQILELEVVAADEEKGYRLKVTTLESQYSDPTKEAIDEVMQERLGSVAYYFETDPYGGFLQVLPVESLEGQQEALAQAILEAVKKKNPASGQLNLLPLIRESVTPEAVVLAATGEISPLFMYHGNRFDLAEEFPIEDEIPAIVGNGTMKMTGSFWIDEELTDDYSVVLRMYKEADPEQMKPFIETLLGNILESMAPSPEDGQDAQTAIEEAFRDARINVEDYLYEEIHLGTGWPIDWNFSREIRIEAEGRQQGQIVETNIRIIVDE